MDYSTDHCDGEVPVGIERLAQILSAIGSCPERTLAQVSQDVVGSVGGGSHCLPGISASA